ncbi:MAG TPA: glutaredoxin family protein [Candidatus Binatia bacterium]|nr:glutaredoxin family protein [Candidatus Binatia bacterium]
MASDNPIPKPDILTVYGADWCPDCIRTKRYLSSAGVPYRYIDLARDRAAQELLIEAGYRSIPVVVAPDGRVLVEPSNAALEALVRAR